MTSSKRRYAILGIVLFVEGMLVISWVLAYYNQSKEIDNAMQTISSEVYLSEVFNENDYWVVGETKEKEVYFGNSGESAQVIRISYESIWLTEQEDEEGALTWLIWEAGESSMISINWTEEFATQWTMIDGYYYYNYILEPEEVTEKVMTSITVSDEITNGGYAEEADYSNKKYRLTFAMEALAVNSDTTYESWNVVFLENADGSLLWALGL
ncbi:MAG: hypothetical protein R3Y40_06915 [Eubacteriales bacterium]